MTAAANPLRRAVWLVDSLKLGGAERLALAFLRATAATARDPALPPWSVELVALQPPVGGGEPAALWGPAWPPTGVTTFDLRTLADLPEWLRLRRWLHHRPPAIVHTHLRYATIWGGAAARSLGLPWVATLHLLPGAEPNRRQRWAAALERHAWRTADRVIYVSSTQARAWRDRDGARAPAARRCRVLANGVAAAAGPAGGRAAARAARGLPAAADVVLTVAVVRARKGWRTWLEVVARVAPLRPQAVFVWLGGGPEFELLRAAAAVHPQRGQIRLPGPRADVGDWLRLADLFLFPSLEEALPTAVIEAMAAGVAVIASDLPAVAEVLGSAGWRVPPGDTAAWTAAALAWTAPAGGAARAQAAAAARQRAREHYGEDAWRKGLLHLYDEVIAERHSHPAGRVLRAGGTAAL